jgi:hypothetical protein
MLKNIPQQLSLLARNMEPQRTIEKEDMTQTLLLVVIGNRLRAA